jgi:adenylate kinase family enzyme
LSIALPPAAVFGILTGPCAEIDLEGFASMPAAPQMRRVLVFGPAGSGKTTVTDRLAGKLGIDSIHLEAHYWQPGWQEPDPDCFRKTVSAFAQRDEWVMDGNFLGTLDIRMPRADHIILLDPPRRIYFSRLLIRTIRNFGRSRAEVGSECPDRINLAFLKEVWNYPVERRPELLRIMSALIPDKRVTVLRSDAEVEALLARVSFDEQAPMRNVLVMGSSGSGKSTFARELAERLGVEVIHLDAAFWKPGWVESSDEEFREKVAALAARDTWVMDGNYTTKTLDLRLPRTDTIIYLDTPRRTCLWRVAKRSVKNYGRTRPDLGDECPEQIDLAFFKWVWDYPKEREPKMLRMLDEQRAEKQVIVLRNKAEIEAFLASVERTKVD